MKKSAATATDKAAAAWGVDLPDWIIELARSIDRSSQNKVAERLGYSASAISQVINNRYKAPLTGIEQAVKGALMAVIVTCPVMGDLAADTCLEHQKAEWSARRAMIQAACQTCANRRDKHAQ
jgi:DNA-binding transcriptional regulator YdaS (Cro superfamily)